MQAFHVYTGSDGDSHLDVVDVMLDRPYPGDHPEGKQSERLASDGFYLTEVGPGHAMTEHNASRRQLMIVLKGRYDIICRSGDHAVLQPGDVLVAEDLSGSGHTTTELTGHGEAVAIPLADFDAARSVFRLQYRAGQALVTVGEEAADGAQA